MKGVISIKFFNDEISYSFSLHRKYSILSGDSATGKSSLVDMLYLYFNDSTFRSITVLECLGFDKILLVKNISNIPRYLSENTNCLIVLDEGDIDNIQLGRFSKELHSSNNYFLFITRETLGYLPYSYKCIYEIETKFSNNCTCNTFVPRYSDINLVDVKPDLILVEDSNSGFQFFSSVIQGECVVDTAKSKSRIRTKLRKLLRCGKHKNIYVIADGAAFGSEINLLVEFIISKVADVEINIFLPESFEYLLLNTKLFNIDNLEDKLKHTYNYCEADKFISWERYYTSLMDEIGYDKNILDNRFLEKDVVERVCSQLTDLDKSVMKGFK